MLDKRDPIKVAEAVNRVMKYALKGDIEYVSINECDERYLGEDVKASHDIPPFDRSPYDGFAIRAEDSKDATQDQPIEFEVIEEIGAGYVAKKKVGPFQAVRIMTGAQMPKECNAVVMLELAKDIVKDGKPYMMIKRPYKPGDNVSYQASETKVGEILVEEGRYINPGIKAVLATFGYAKVPVVKKTVVGLYATGTELLDVDEAMQPGKIRNSNAYMIASQIKRAGAEPKYFGKLEDDFDTCFEAVKNALNEVDMLITTGGVSVGDYDYMPEIYKKLGAAVLFNKIAMRPGSVTTVAEFNGKLLFGLSGNPSACFVGFELFTRPIIRSWFHSKKPYLQKIKATLYTDFPKPNPFTRFVRSRLVYNDGKLFVEPSGLDKSNVVTSLVDCNALMILPGGTRGYSTGDEVEVLLLEDQKGSEWPWN
ncbi:MAG TPA: molybdopterin molybdotransferase MoeA [Bacillus bacterium]|nr:molybdopterin molybdotransferase MoeA [Bacillus sp. (in: firmicutes)]